MPTLPGDIPSENPIEGLTHRGLDEGKRGCQIMLPLTPGRGSHNGRNGGGVAALGNFHFAAEKE
jgi:hypothetical protein